MILQVFWCCTRQEEEIEINEKGEEDSETRVVKREGHRNNFRKKEKEEIITGDEDEDSQSGRGKTMMIERQMRPTNPTGSHLC